MKLLYELEENEVKKLVLANLREMFPNADQEQAKLQIRMGTSFVSGESGNANMKKPSSAREDIGYTTRLRPKATARQAMFHRTVEHNKAMKLAMPTFEQHMEALRQ